MRLEPEPARGPEIASAGERYGAWRLEEAVARGNYAQVWRAFHVETGEQVAVKIATDERGARMLRAEAAIGTEPLSGVVPIFETGELPRPFVVMPWIGAYTLRDFLDGTAYRAEWHAARDDRARREQARDIFGRRIRPGRVHVKAHYKEARAAGKRGGIFYRLRKYLAVLDTVRGLHTAGLVHGDLKPENVLLRDEDGGALVSDFGLAQELQAYRREQRLDHSLHSERGLVGGTLAYLPPEGVKGGEPAPTGDVYALGVMLHEVLFFARPDRAGAAGSGRGVPRPLVEVMTRALAYDPADRYQDARELTIALRLALSSIEVSELVRPPGQVSSRLQRAVEQFCAVCLLLAYLAMPIAAFVFQTWWLLAALLLMPGLHLATWDWQSQTLSRRWTDVAAPARRRLRSAR